MPVFICIFRKEDVCKKRISRAVNHISPLSLLLRCSCSAQGHIACHIPSRTCRPQRRAVAASQPCRTVSQRQIQSALLGRQGGMLSVDHRMSGRCGQYNELRELRSEHMVRDRKLTGLLGCGGRFASFCGTTSETRIMNSGQRRLERITGSNMFQNGK